jgi:rfaE bifunctional protein kinase chain/domain
VVKGKEYEDAFNREKEAVDSYGGKLLFCSGETRFSSLDLLHHELRDINRSTIVKPTDFPRRHGFSCDDLISVVESYSTLRVLVIGDLIVDEYVSCEALGMSQEDPTLVVSPVSYDRFVGGAGIVAAHARGLGASVKFFSVVGQDATAAFAAERLQNYDVDPVFLEDSSRPTTLKQRYRAGEKTLLRVSHLRHHDISRELANQLFERIHPALDDVNLVIFADFNYGGLPQPLVNRITTACVDRGIMMVADSQASSQIGDVSRFKGMRLLTPTEREARLAVRDTRSGLVVLAEALRRKAKADQVLITLGAEGLLIHAPEYGAPVITDRLPAFNMAPKDVSGAGDSLLTCTAMAVATGHDIWRSAYLGAVAAACQVGRVGNSPLSATQLIVELRQ